MVYFLDKEDCLYNIDEDKVLKLKHIGSLRVE